MLSEVNIITLVNLLKILPACRQNLLPAELFAAILHLQVRRASPAVSVRLASEAIGLDSPAAASALCKPPSG